MECNGDPPGSSDPGGDFPDGAVGGVAVDLNQNSQPSAANPGVALPGTAQSQGGIAPLVNTFNQLAAGQSGPILDGQLVSAAQNILSRYNASLANGGQIASGGTASQINPNLLLTAVAPLQPIAGSIAPNIVIEGAAPPSNTGGGGLIAPNFSGTEGHSNDEGDPPPRKSLAPDWGKNPFAKTNAKKGKGKGKANKDAEKAKKQRTRFASPASSVSSVGSPRGRAGSRGEKIARENKENEQLASTMRNFVNTNGPNTPAGENAAKKRKQISPTGGGSGNEDKTSDEQFDDCLKLSELEAELNAISILAANIPCSITREVMMRFGKLQKDNLALNQKLLSRLESAPPPPPPRGQKLPVGIVAISLAIEPQLSTRQLLPIMLCLIMTI